MAFAALCSAPVTPSPRAGVRIGKFWRPFGPVSGSRVSFAVTPPGSRSMPRAALALIAFRRMLLPLPALTATPAWPLLAITFPSVAPVPPSCVFGRRSADDSKLDAVFAVSERSGGSLTPMLLPWITRPVPSSRAIPAPVFPEISLPAPGPPTVFAPALFSIRTPIAFGIAEAPVRSVPM